MQNPMAPCLYEGFFSVPIVQVEGLSEADCLHSDISKDKRLPTREENGVFDAYSTLGQGGIPGSNTSARQY